MATTTPSNIISSYRTRVRIADVLVGVLLTLVIGMAAATIYVARYHQDPVANFDALRTGALFTAVVLGGIAGALRRKPDDE